MWYSNDFNHRLKPQNILEIISIAENSIISEDLEVEVEYQDSTIGKYGLSFNGENFILKSKTTNCLAEDNCGIQNSKPKVALIKLQDENCSPGSGCCWWNSNQKISSISRLNNWLCFKSSSVNKISVRNNSSLEDENY